MKRSKLYVALYAALGLMLPALSLAAEETTTASGSTEVSATGTASATETELNAQTRQMDSLAASAGQKTVSRKIAADFADFAGSRENAEALAAGLRNGAEISLTGAAGGTAAFTPPTGHMGNGNVYKSLALAKQQLADIGITDPTPEQIQTALMGGTVSGVDGTSHQLDGILQMRSEGMGWEQIAKSQGMNLGKVVGSMKSANAFLKNPKAQEVASETAVTTVESATSKTAKQKADASKNKAGESRILNAEGGARTSDQHSGKSKVTSAGGDISGSGKSHTRTRSSIVTASGAPAGGVVIKSQHSRSSSATQVSGAGGNAKSGGQGHFK
ncbi:MAG: hypothetical protein M1392_04220 [Gammaproteobacteria bacterium]|nr:hypothetical protein [Gammaproteobacteria bacterium]